jgi:hypothetical protein
MSLLCDLMTQRGSLMAISRHGIDRAGIDRTDTGALVRSSFVRGDCRDSYGGGCCWRAGRLPRHRGECHVRSGGSYMGTGARGPHASYPWTRVVPTSASMQRPSLTRRARLCRVARRSLQTPSMPSPESLPRAPPRRMAPTRRPGHIRHPPSVSHLPPSSYERRPQNHPDGTSTQSSDSPHSSFNTTNAAANGLFLLSWAHRELTKREEAQRAQPLGR